MVIKYGCHMSWSSLGFLKCQNLYLILLTIYMIYVMYTIRAYDALYIYYEKFSTKIENWAESDRIASYHLEIDQKNLLDSVP